jgi:hypothetical protein
MFMLVRNSAPFTIAALLAVGLAAPSLARSSHPNGAGGSEVTYDTKTGHYCIADDLTGSRLPQVTCKSREDWAADGLTISGR